MGTENNVRVAAYCRVGNKEQVDDRRTALYCRVASRDDDAIRAQEERLRRFAEDNGYTNLVPYIDNGVAGTTLNRPAMNQLIADIKEDAIKTVLVTRADRIARGLLPFAEWVRLLRDTDIQCASADAGESGFNNEFGFWNDIYDHIASES